MPRKAKPLTKKERVDALRSARQFASSLSLQLESYASVDRSEAGDLDDVCTLIADLTDTAVDILNAELKVRGLQRLPMGTHRKVYQVLRKRVDQLTALEEHA